MSIGGNYFGVNYNRHYQRAQGQQGYRPSGQYQRPQARRNQRGYSHQQNLFQQLFRLIRSLLNRQQNEQGGCGTGGFRPCPPPSPRHKECGTGEGPIPKPAYFEGPVGKYAIGTEGPVGKLVAGPGEGPGPGKLVAKESTTEGPGKLVAKESTTEGPTKRVAKTEGIYEGP